LTVRIHSKQSDTSHYWEKQQNKQFSGLYLSSRGIKSGLDWAGYDNRHYGNKKYIQNFSYKMSWKQTICKAEMCIGGNIKMDIREIFVCYLFVS
jgi:hypothetical protein